MKTASQTHTRSPDVMNVVTVIIMADREKSTAITTYFILFLTKLEQVWTTVYRHIECILLVYIIKYYAYCMHGLQKELFGS